MNNKDQSLFSLLTNSDQNFDTMLIFLIGYNYHKFEDNYKGQSFFELAEIIQKKINTKLLSKVELEKTYRVLYEQEALSEVLGLMWFKRYKQKFETENEEVSLMINQQRQDKIYKKREKPIEFVKEEIKELKPEIVEKEEPKQNLPVFLQDTDPVEIEKIPELIKEESNYEKLLTEQMKIERQQEIYEEQQKQLLIKQLMEEEEKYLMEEKERK